jgi:hypothetical protein
MCPSQQIVCLPWVLPVYYATCTAASNAAAAAATNYK